jgi:cytochrome b6-f complex iron-sulfur subunit
MAVAMVETRCDALARLVMWLAAAPSAAVASFIGVRFLQPVRRQRVIGVVAARAIELPRDAALQVNGILGYRLVLRRDRDRILAFSTVCPHLGCTVAWQEAAREFVCPCHAGRFDAAGAPVAGPVKGHLQRFPARQQGELIVVELPTGEEG